MWKIKAGQNKDYVIDYRVEKAALSPKQLNNIV